MNRKVIPALAFAATSFIRIGSAAAGETHLYMDVHELESVTASAVADAHAKDLAVQEKYGVGFISYWVDEANGKVYCLAEAPTPQAISAAHAEAHGLIPQQIHEVTDGVPESGPARSRPMMLPRRTRRTWLCRLATASTSSTTGSIRDRATSFVCRKPTAPPPYWRHIATRMASSAMRSPR